MKNKVLTISLRTLTSNILLLETKQLLKTSFWEVRLLFFSLFKKSFLKVTQTLLSFLSFFRSIWLIPLKPFFVEISSFFQRFLVMLCLLSNTYVLLRVSMKGRKRHVRKQGKHAKHTSRKEVSYQHTAVGRDPAQVCSP